MKRKKRRSFNAEFKAEAVRLVLSWLRLLAYNLLSLVRTYLSARDGRPASFARTMEVLYQGLLGLAVLPESLATLA